MGRFLPTLVVPVVLLAGAGDAQEPEVTVPSGQPLELYESFVPEEGAGILYVSYLAPNLGESSVTYDVADADMEAICSDFALAEAAKADEPISEVFIRLMAEPIDYGATAPGVTQYAASYDVTSGACEYM